MAGPWEEFAPKPWEGYGKPGSIADFPNAPGFVSTVKRTAGQMLTTGATSIEDITGPNAVTGAVRSAGQGIIDRNPAGIQSLSDAAESPWLTTKEALGQLVPQVAAAAIGMKAGGAIGRKIGGARGAGIGGEIGSLAPIASQEYGGIREDQKEAGQEDKGRALLAAAGATALERVGMGKLLKGIRGELPPMAKIPAEIAKGFAKEGATEAAQTAIEQVGAFKDPTTSESMQEQALAGVMGGIGGGILGGVHAGAQKLLGGGETKPAPGETKPAAAGTPGAESGTEPVQSVTPAAPAATPDAVRAQKLPETGGPLTGAVNAGIEAQAQGLEAAAGKQPLTEDEMLAAQFHVEQRRQDGTPAGARFAAAYDAGLISPREALEAFRLSRSPEFTLPQPGVTARELSLEEAAALAGPQGDQLQQQLIPAGDATELPVEQVDPAPPIEQQRAARTPPAEGVTIDPRAPNAVAQYVDRMRGINTPAAQAFVRDFEAGRITPADVMQLVAPTENADANLQTARRALGLKDVAAGAQQTDRTQLLGPDGLPLPPAAAPRTLRDAQAKRAAEKAQQAQQPEAPSAQPAAVQPAAPEAPAAQQQPAPAAPAGAAPATAVAQPAEVGTAAPAAVDAPAAPAAAPKPGEKWHYRSSAAGTPLREMPADRLKDAREVDLVPGLRFLVHRDVDAGKTWSVTERTTGNTLTAGHSSAELAEFAAGQRVQQVGADKVRARVREMLQQQGGLSEDEALNGTAEPRKGKVPGLNEVLAAYKRAAGGDLDANMNATAVVFHRALADQNAKTVRDLVHPDNPVSRRAFEALALSGRKLPRGAKESARIAEDWLRSLHQESAPDAAAPVSTQAPAQAGATVAAAPATPTDMTAKRRAVLQALRDCIAG